MTNLGQSEHQKITIIQAPPLRSCLSKSRRTQNTPASKCNLLVLVSTYEPASRYKHQSRHVGHGDCATHRVATHLPAGIEGVRKHASISLLRTSAGDSCLASNGDWCWKKIFKLVS